MRKFAQAVLRGVFDISLVGLAVTAIQYVLISLIIYLISIALPGMGWDKVVDAIGDFAPGAVIIVTAVLLVMAMLAFGAVAFMFAAVLVMFGAAVGGVAILQAVLPQPFAAVAAIVWFIFACWVGITIWRKITGADKDGGGGGSGGAGTGGVGGRRTDIRTL